MTLQRWWVGYVEGRTQVVELWQTLSTGELTSRDEWHCLTARTVLPGLSHGSTPSNGLRSDWTDREVSALDARLHPTTVEALRNNDVFALHRSGGQDSHCMGPAKSRSIRSTLSVSHRSLDTREQIEENRTHRLCQSPVSILHTVFQSATRTQTHSRLYKNTPLSLRPYGLFNPLSLPACPSCKV